MKKIILLCMLLFSFSLVSAQEEEIEEVCTIDNGWSYRSLRKKLDNSELIMARFYKTANQETGFCIEPDVQFLKCSEYVSERFDHGKIEEIAKVIKSFEALGGSDELYVAAQLMIWEIMGTPKSVNGDYGYGYGRGEIEEHIKHNYASKIPSIPGEMEIELGKVYEIKDENEVLSGPYEVEGSPFSILEKDGNLLRFSTDSIYPVVKEIRINSTESVREILANNSVLYRSNDSQNIMQLHGSFPVYYQSTLLKVRHKTGDLIVEKKDEWGSDVLNEVTFRLYYAIKGEDGFEVGDEIFQENGDLWKTKNGILSIEGILPPGHYYLKEENADGYIENSDLVLLKIEEGEKTHFHYFNENERIRLKINKVDEEGKELKGATFSLYDISSLLDFDGRSTILGTGFDGVMEGEMLMDQMSGREDYPKEEILLLKTNQSFDIYKTFLSDEKNKILKEGNLPIEMKLSHNYCADVHEETFQLKTHRAGYFDYEIYEGNYPSYFLQNMAGHFKVFDKEGTEISDHFEILVSEKGYHFKLLNENIELSFDIPKEDASDYLEKKEFSPSKKERRQIASGRAYVLDSLPENTLKMQGLKLYEGKTGERKLQLQDSNNHSLYLKGVSLCFYKDEALSNLYQTRISDELGFIDLSDFEVGTYYYKWDDVVQKLEILEPVENTLEIDGLRYGRKYLLCESGLPDGYEYIDDPCVFLDVTTTEKEMAVTMKNKMRHIGVSLKKMNENRTILLDGARFEVYTKAIEEGAASGETLLKKEYITGGLIIEREEGMNFLYLKDSEGIIISYPFDGHDHLTLNRLAPGKYEYLCSEKELTDFKDQQWMSKEVIKGGFLIEDVPYHHRVYLKEVKAPSGYFIKESEFEITPELPYGFITMENSRINHAIVIPNTGCYEK